MDAKLLNELIDFRRHLHENPELGYQEFETANLVCQKLDQLQIPYQRGIAKTGIVAELRKGSGNCIALRADMDALPIQEETGLPFASKKNGIMHACGHDIHTTMLLGAASLLKESDFKGSIKFIFQPSEEGVNGDNENKSGGQRMVESGILNDVDYAIGLHVLSTQKLGTLSYSPGNALACTSSFTIIVHGKASHAGAAPHLGIDSILVATTIIQNLHTIVSRNISPTQSGVVSVTMISGGTAPNIIADKVEIRGTIRSLELPDYNLILKRFNEIIQGAEQMFEAKVEFKIDSFYPCVINNEEVCEKLKITANEIFPNGLIVTKPMLGGEDFAFYSLKVPSMYYFIGAEFENEITYFLHHPKVIMNENCIPLGVNFLTKATKVLLNS